MKRELAEAATAAPDPVSGNNYDEELNTLKERAAYFELDKTKDFDEFKRKYINAVDNSNESGIMELYRKKEKHSKISEDSRKIIDKPTYNKIVNPIIKKGADVRIANDEWLRRLEEANATAVTIGDVIIFRPDATVSDVLEETHHFMQNKQGLNCQYGSVQREILNEIEAKEYLISVIDKYKIPEEEIHITKQQLKNYRHQMEEMKKRGEWVD